MKKEHIYYKPFYKQKLKMTLLLVIIMAVVFFSYQIFCMNQLNKTIAFFDVDKERGSGYKADRHNVQYNRFHQVAESRNR